MGRLGDKVDMLRINIQGREATLFSDLKHGFMDEFNELGIHTSSFKTYWENADSVLMPIENTSGLRTALAEMQGPIYNIIVQVKNEGSFRFIIFLNTFPPRYHRLRYIKYHIYL